MPYTIDQNQRPTSHNHNALHLYIRYVFLSQPHTHDSVRRHSPCRSSSHFDRTEPIVRGTGAVAELHIAAHLNPWLCLEIKWKYLSNSCGSEFCEPHHGTSIDPFGMGTSSLFHVGWFHESITPAIHPLAIISSYGSQEERLFDWRPSVQTANRVNKHR